MNTILGILSLLAVVIHVSPKDDLSKTIKDAHNIKKSVQIYLSNGVYYIPEELSMEYWGQDLNDFSLSIIGSEKSVISGGIKLSGFESLTDNLWRIDVSQIKENIQQLFVNDKRAIPARSKNYVPKYENINTSTSKKHALGVNQDVIDILDNCQSDKVRLNVINSWNFYCGYIDSWNRDSCELYSTGKRYKFFKKDCSLFWLDNDRSLLNEEGEFFHDLKNGYIYYVPRDGETIFDSYIEIPMINKILSINHCNNISFTNVVFSVTKNDTSFTETSYGQGAALSPASIEINNSNRISFNKCTIRHTGLTGIWFKENCCDCKLENSLIEDVGACGIKIGVNAKKVVIENPTKYVVIRNNSIRNGGKITPTGEGILLMQASDCTIESNDIHDFYYTGISLGWTWGYAQSVAKRNKVYYNHIYNIGDSLMCDMGGIYTLGQSQGTEIKFNVIHDVYSFGYGGWGIYLDEGSSDILVEGNLVYKCKDAGFMQHYGKNNIIKGNVFINQERNQLEIERKEMHQSFSFINNIIIYSDGELIGRKWNKANFNSMNNLYWHNGKKVLFDNQTLNDWQKKTGKDIGSIIVNPQLVWNRDGTVSFRNKKALKKIHFSQPYWRRAVNILKKNDI